MTNKKLLIVILAMLTITTIVGLVAFSYAWYKQLQSDTLSYSLDADGFLILYFDEDVDYSDTILSPAILMEDALKNNEYYDIFTVYNAEDATPSYVESAATVASYSAVLNYLNEEEEDSSDDYNQITIICEVVSILSDDSEIPINLERELNLIISAEIIDNTGEIDTYTIDSITSGVAFDVPLNSIVTFNLEAYILLPDELCDPAINEGTLSIRMYVSTDADE
jgi:hypothetical protein